MDLPGMLSDYTLPLLAEGLLGLGLLIFWACMRSMRGILALLSGLIPFGLAFCSVQLATSYTPPDCKIDSMACEGRGLGLAVMLIGSIGLGVIYLISSGILALLYRRLVWKGTPPQQASGDMAVGLTLRPALTAVLGLILGTAINFILISGLFYPWQIRSIPVEVKPRGEGIYLQTPQPNYGGSEKATHILLASGNTVYVETDKQRVLEASFDAPYPKGLTGGVVWRDSGPPIASFRSNYTACSSSVLVPPLLENILDRVEGQVCDHVIVTRGSYAVLSDGRLAVWYYWQQPSDMGVGVVGGPPVGFLFGLVWAGVIERRRLLRERETGPA